MATQDENITERSFAEELSKSFLTYAVAVVSSRAIPSVLDGMKPVVRRCVFAAYEGGYRSDRPSVKSSRIVGDAMGKYHPHGDSAVYETIVGLVQPWGNNIPLFDGTGNWGSPGKEDPAAAPRYCVTGDARVRMADGTTRTLKEIAHEHGVTGPGEEVVDLQVLGARGEPVPADRVFHSGRHETFRVQTRTGRTLQGTGNHPVLTLVPHPETGQPVRVWKELDDVVPGDYILTLRTPPTATGPRPVAESLSTVGLEVDTAHVLGAFLSGGGHLGVETTDERWVTELRGAYRRITGADLARRGDLLHVRSRADLGTTPLSLLVDEPAGVPSWVWSRGPGVKREFLTALLRSVRVPTLSPSKGAVLLRSADSSLVTGVQELLLEQGIVTRTRANLSGSGDLELVVDTGSDLLRLYALTRNAAHLSQGSVSASAGRDRVPFLAAWLHRAVPQTRNYADIDVADSWTGTSEHLREAIPDQHLQVVESLLDGTHFYDEVTSIDPAGPADVYSLRIANREHAFITNGFVSHNTEARLTPAAELMCESIEEDAVDMVDNYDATLKEPAVLPASFPNLLINGTSGIAVGMACTFAPHNIGEVTNALLHLLKHPDATVDELMKHLPGPDFPTGGVIVDGGGIREAYATGTGGIRLRARTSIEDISARRRGIVVTELPFGVGPEAVIERINDAKSKERLDGVGRVTNFTDRKSGLRLVIEVKAGADPDQVLAQLFKYTPMERSFNFNQVALVGREPRLMGMPELCHHYLDHRVAVISRRSKHRLRKAEARAHIVEGLIKAHAEIDEVVKLIKASRNTKTASQKLRKAFDLSEKQATAILEMTLRRLTGLEITALRDELKDLNSTISYLRDLLNSTEKLKGVVADELKATAKKLSFDRRSEIVSASAVAAAEPAAADSVDIEEAPVTIHWDVDGRIFLADPKAHPDRPVRQTLAAVNTDTVGVVTNLGNLFGFPAVGLSETPFPLADHVELPEGEHAVGLVPRESDTEQVVLVTRAGAIKLISAAQFAKRDGLPIIRLKNGDEVISVRPVGPAETATLVTSDARMLRVDLGTIRPQGRTGGGVAGIRLATDAVVLAGGPVSEDTYLTTLTDGGSAKATKMEGYPVKGRAGAGVRCHNFKKADTVLVNAALVDGEPRAATARAVKPVRVVERRDASGVKVGLTGPMELGA